MKLELQNDLVKAYPKIFKNVGGDPMVTCMAWGIECNDGWYDLLDTLCHSIQQHCDVANTRYIIETDKYEFILEGDPEYVQVVAAQVKEKLGTLRFYVDGGDAATGSMIQMAETMSGRICELCGSPAKTNRESGWLHTTCDACNKRIRDCYKQEVARDTLSQEVSQDVSLRKGLKQAKEGKFSKNPPKIELTKKKKK